ncbi:YdeI/OmpD-associated family protein [Actinocorallia sp. A-T 12471]|uniref:YdeI/OmpD-associated family protein n=1 Tax=Actinocorallia sp. A-T 12471 TaxID=3089813 RepID=UPI0029CB13BF|nr:YdeI/OmpD-associated family protein [Actinocorallia sp. A-T 12471]MDX6743664.1 YdeI/OmpD-associated family protein [Actinocorallia sp. A-T 12471]
MDVETGVPAGVGADGLPVFAFATEAEFEAWLEQEHATSQGLWIKIAKKASGIASVTAPEALDHALCFGWIDGQRKGFDATYFLQKYTPRRPRSRWSKVNTGKIAELEAAGRMRPAGLAQVAAAKADGRWDAAYAPQSSRDVPADLQAALDAEPEAAAFFATLSSQNRFAVVFRVEDAKRATTRAARIEKFVQMLKEGKTFY